MTMSKNNTTTLLITLVMACVCAATMITHPTKWHDGKGEPGVTAYQNSVGYKL